jgi:ketosteroid isomerase-like protein
MKNTFIILPVIVIGIIMSTCNLHTKVVDNKNAEEEIRKAEKDFEQMAAEKGIAEAFAFFADSNAVIKRGQDSIIHGKEGIRNYYSADYFKSASVKWSPDFVSVSKSGDMGFTYGKFNWQSKDSTGKTNELKGIFHTVWKKQEDGTWKYVWD